MEFSLQVKVARKELKLTQIDFAKQLKIGVATLIRWENGYTIPHQISQEHFYNFCRNKGLQFNDEKNIFERI